MAGTYVYNPAAGDVPGAGNDTLSVTFTPTDTAAYNTATATTTLTVNPAKPTIAWATPAPIIQGAALGRCPARCHGLGVGGVALTGTFVYTPAANFVLGVGTGQTLSVTFTPTSANYTAASGTTTITVTASAAPSDDHQHHLIFVRFPRRVRISTVWR